ncbi:MAG: NAD(P)-binding domain-containing protein [Acidobacteriota bacterium]
MPRQTSADAQRPSHDVLIVGAGPYGLAVALDLHRRGLRPKVFGEPFELWHRHTFDRMRLRSDVRMSSIGPYDFAAFLERRGIDPATDRIGVEAYREFLVEVADQLPFPIVRARIDQLERRGDGSFAVTVDGQAFAAPAVVVATGNGAHRYTPPVLEALPADRVVHSWDTQAIERWVDRRVLVVGAGQSAAEAVETLLAQGQRSLRWALRHPMLFFREPLRAPTPIFKVMLAVSPALYKLPRAVRAGLQRACFRTTVTPDLRPVYDDPRVEKIFVDAEGLALEAVEGPDGFELRSGWDDARYDVVVSATGFRYSVAGLPFLSAGLREALGGAAALPPLDDDFQSAVPGLYLIGGIAEGTFGPAQRFLLGSRHAAKRVGRALAARAGVSADRLAA